MWNSNNRYMEQVYGTGVYIYAPYTEGTHHIHGLNEVCGTL